MGSQRQLEVSLSDAELEAALANNTELFNPEYLTPLRQLEITLDDFDLETALVNNTELFNPEFLDPLKRSASSRATTQCGCGYASAAGRIVAGQEVNPMHSRPYQVYLQSCSSKGCAMCGATLPNIADGWCSSESFTATTTPASTANNSNGQSCDMSCTNVGQLTADCSLNGVPSRCDGGVCYAKDGTNLCQMFGNPCGQAPTTTPAPGINCAKPCNLRFVLDGIRGSATSNIVNVNVGFFPKIPAACDLSTNLCCPTDD